MRCAVKVSFVAVESRDFDVALRAYQLHVCSSWWLACGLRRFVFGAAISFLRLEKPTMNEAASKVEACCYLNVAYFHRLSLHCGVFISSSFFSGFFLNFLRWLIVSRLLLAAQNVAYSPDHAAKKAKGIDVELNLRSVTKREKLASVDRNITLSTWLSHAQPGLWGFWDFLVETTYIASTNISKRKSSGGSWEAKMLFLSVDASNKCLKLRICDSSS